MIDGCFDASTENTRLDSELEVKDTILIYARLFFALIAEKCHKNVEN